MMQAIRATIVAVGLVGAVLAQAPTPKPAPSPAPGPDVIPTAITGETSVACYGFLKFDVSGPFKSAFWISIPQGSSGAAVVNECVIQAWKRPDGQSASSYILGGSPGRYTVTCVVSDAHGEMKALVVVGEIRPPGQPLPQPTPIPGPTPQPGPRPPFPSTMATPQRITRG